MPKKTVREMTRLERLHYSLGARVFHATIMGSAVLGLLALLIGLSFYTWSLLGQYIGDAYNLSRDTAAVLEKVVDTDALTEEVMQIYRGMSDEERVATGTSSYRDLFAHVTETEEFRTVQEILTVFGRSSHIGDIFLGVFDEQTKAFVYLCDANTLEQKGRSTGEWLAVPDKDLDRFMNWDGEERLRIYNKSEQYGWNATSGVTVGTDGDHTRTFILANTTLGNVGRGIRVFTLQYSVALAIAVVILGFFMTRHMKKTIVKPVNEIAGAAEQYVRDRQEGKNNTDHFSALGIRTGDELENLCFVMADMEQNLTDYEDNLQKITAEKERISTELTLATRIQADMLPNIYPAFPERSEFDIYAAMIPAKEVGGDFYDFFLTDEDHLAIIMADVSGKGVPAALFMMAAKIILSNNAMMGLSPSEILEGTNKAICSNNREEMFVTVWLGILELSTGRLRAANAGHEYPLLMKQQGANFSLVRDQHSFVVGGMEDVHYLEYEMTLKPGAKLFVYTDGVPEATDRSGRMFGEARTLEVLNSETDADPRQLLENVKKAVDDFVGDAEQFDDLTMLCLEYFGKQPGRDSDHSTG